jgi:hypothetical protein
VQKPYALRTLLQNKKSIPDETKKAILKKEEHVSVYKDKLMIMK